MILNALFRPRLLAAGVAAFGLGATGLAWASHGGSGGSGHGFHAFRATAIKMHVEFMADRALRVAEATPEQRATVEAILEKAFADQEQARADRESLHKEALEIFTSDTIDRVRLEGLRAKHMQLAEQSSQRITQTLGDVADVLTPAQRQKLAAHVRQMFE